MKNSRNRKLFLIVPLLIVAGLLVSPPRHRIERGGEIPAPTQQAGTASPSPTKTPNPKVMPTQSDLSQLVPSADEIRNETKLRPDAPPSALIRFSKVVSERMEKALPDPESSRSLMSELRACALRKDVTASIHVICLKNAETLAQAYPPLRPEFNKAKERASPESKRILEAFGSMGGHS